MSVSMNEIPADGVTPSLACQVYSGEQWSVREDAVPGELPLTIYINGQELVTVLCTPSKLKCLVLGFLYSEGIISGTQDIATLRLCEEDALADVKLVRSGYTPPAKRMLTSGCGGGTSFKTIELPVLSDLKVSPVQLLSLMKQMKQHQELFQASGGVHCSALCSPEAILVLAEDIGRHNTLDKIAGECLLRNIAMSDRILLTTGRISSEMLLKSARMQSPVIVSRGAATDRAITLGRDLGISVVGYARAGRLSVYSGEERLVNDHKALAVD